MCPFKSKPLLPISNNKVKVKVSVIFVLGSEMQLLILTWRAAFGGHFVTLIFCIPGNE